MQQERSRESQTLRRIASHGWAHVLRQTLTDIGEKDLPLIAAGVTYYLVLAFFPALATLASVYSLVASAQDAAKNAQSLSGLLPQPTVDLIGDGLRHLVSASSRGLGIGAVTGTLIALYSSVRGMRGMMAALNIAAGETEQRGYVRLYATALMLTALVIVGGLVALTLIALAPAVLHRTGAVIEWPLLIGLSACILAVLYRYGPDRHRPHWKWASLGVITATIMWLVASAGFSAYIYYFGHYNRIYGSLGVPLVLLSWMWLSVFAALFGAEVDGQGERQAKEARS